MMIMMMIIIIIFVMLIMMMMMMIMRITSILLWQHVHLSKYTRSRETLCMLLGRTLV